MLETLLASLHGTVEPDYLVDSSGGFGGWIAMLSVLVWYVLPAIASIAVIAAALAHLSIAKSLRTLVHAHKLGPEAMGQNRDDIT